MLDRAEQRRANFFRGTKRDPEMHAIPEALEAQALTTIETNIRAQADAEGRPIDTAKVKQALAVAQRLLRQLPPEQIQSIASSGGLLQSITAQSLAGTKTQVAGDKSDPRVLPDGSGTGRDSGATLLRFSDGARMSGARFSEIGGNPSIEVARNIELARQQAMRLGMPWAANHPDLLKLGPAAIKAIAETNLRETGYKALRNGAYYEAPDIVAFAKHSKLRGFDAEKAAKSTEALVQALPPAEQKSTSEVLRRFDHAAAAYYANPNDAAARERFEAAGKAQKQRMEEIAQRSQADRARVQRLEDDKRVEQRFRATTVGNEHRATLTEQREASELQATDAAKEKAATARASNLGGLDDEPTEKSGDPTPGKGAPPPAATVSPPAKGTPAKPPAPK